MHRDEETVCSARINFDTVLEDYHIVSSRPNADAQIVHDPHFKSAFFKKQEVQEGLLNVTEEKQVSGLLLECEIFGEVDITNNFIIESATKRAIGIQLTTRSQNLDTRFFLPG